MQVKGAFIVLNEKGLHTRPSTELVKCASAFKSKIELYTQAQSADAKSILSILMLAASKGTKVRIVAEGEDAEAAVAALLALAKQKFHIHY